MEKDKQKYKDSKIVSDSKLHAFWDFWGPILLTLSTYIGIRHYIAEARYIPSGSMLPGLQIQDRLLVEKITYRQRLPRRGEIIVFNSPYSFDPTLRSKKGKSVFKCALLNFPLIASIPGLSDHACDAYIKRVVAVSGDHVLVNRKGEVFINGSLINEPYVENYCPLNSLGKGLCLGLNLNVPGGYVLVLGDNRKNSWDSRFWPGSAFLPVEEILGRAIWRFWPIDRLGYLDS